MHRVVHWTLRRRQDDGELCPGGVPGVARHPGLLPRRRQHAPRPQQEPGLQRRGPRGEHPPSGRGRQAVRRLRGGGAVLLRVALHQGS